MEIDDIHFTKLFFCTVTEWRINLPKLPGQDTAHGMTDAHSHHNMQLSEKVKLASTHTVRP